MLFEIIKMDAYKHAEISVKKRGGKIEDYYPIHFFMDSTKASGIT